MPSDMFLVFQYCTPSMPACHICMEVYWDKKGIPADFLPGAMVYTGNYYAKLENFGRAIQSKMCRMIGTDLLLIQYSARSHAVKAFVHVQTIVTRWLYSHSAYVYDTGLKKRIPRFDNCYHSGDS